MWKPCVEVVKAVSEVMSDGLPEVANTGRQIIYTGAFEDLQVKMYSDLRETAPGPNLFQVHDKSFESLYKVDTSVGFVDIDDNDNGLRMSSLPSATKPAIFAGVSEPNIIYLHPDANPDLELDQDLPVDDQVRMEELLSIEKQYWGDVMCGGEANTKNKK